MIASTGLSRAALAAVLAFSVSSLSLAEEGAKEECAKAFDSSAGQAAAAETKPAAPANPLQAALAARAPMEAYFGAVRSNLKERDYLVDLAELALISEEHLLLMGPPGNAKSMLADQVLGGITDAKSKDRSYYRIQMTPETTLSETHGPLDFKTLTKTNRYERIYSEGMLMSRNVFIDEIFDARANAMRNVLGLLAERAHAQGPRVIKGDIETVVAATNKYISEVYERAGDDSPKALLDRFAFSAFVPGDFEMMDSAVGLIRGAKKSAKALPPLTFEELEAVRALVPQVDVPEYVARFLALLRFRIKAETENLEQASLKTYKDKLRNGEEAPPPYRATKYQSPRTLGKAAAVLKAIVVREWLKSGGKRPLRASLEDVRRLEAFFCLNGPSDAFVQAELERATNPHERAQLAGILQERQVFRRNFDQIMTELNSTLYKFALSEIQSDFDSQLSAPEKMDLVRRLVPMLLEVQNARIAGGKQSEFSGEMIALDQVYDFLTHGLQDLLGDKYQVTVEKVLKEAEERRLREVAEAERRERERIAEERRKEEARIAAQREQERLDAERKARAAQLALRFTDPSRFKTLAGPSSYYQGVMYNGSTAHGSAAHLYSNAVNVVDADRKASFAVPANSPDGVLASVLSGNQGTVAGIQMPDDEHVMVIAGSSAWVFKADTGAFVSDLPIAADSANRIAFSPDRSTMYVLDTKLKRVLAIDWKTGAANRVMITAAKSAGRDVTSQLATLMGSHQANTDLFTVSADGKKAFFTGSNMTKVYEIDLDQGVLTDLGETSKPNVTYTRLGVSSDRKRGYGYRQNGNEIEILETHFSGSSEKDRVHVIPLEAGIGSLRGTGTIVGDGSFAVFGTESGGLILLDLANNQMVAKNILGSSPWTQDPRAFGNKIGWVDYNRASSSYTFKLAQFEE